jgi:Fe-S-cluster-containing hydrogenase component 2
MLKSVSLHIDLNLCHACQRCQAVLACRTKAIMQPDPGEPPYLDFERCRECQICVPSCPFGAVRSMASER